LTEGDEVEFETEKTQKGLSAIKVALKGQGFSGEGKAPKKKKEDEFKNFVIDESIPDSEDF